MSGCLEEFWVLTVCLAFYVYFFNVPLTPAGLSCCTVLYPEAAVLHAASIFAVSDHIIWGRLRGLQLRRQVSLDTADHDLQTKDLSEKE